VPETNCISTNATTAACSPENRVDSDDEMVFM